MAIGFCSSSEIQRVVAKENVLVDSLWMDVLSQRIHHVKREIGVITKPVLMFNTKEIELA